MNEADAKSQQKEAMTSEAIEALNRHTKALRLNSAAAMSALPLELAEEYTGASKGKLWLAVRNGELSQSKRGKLVYFRRLDLDAWMLCQEKETKPKAKPRRAKYGTGQLPI
ncbi:MAG: helix-turn-helix domain-containing protein [Candidatus Fibromonas sp.]|jgi:hypothetical protein|nr:helix-turn-helix domain-containing protein [Candidatus Fibromonas sp.]